MNDNQNNLHTIKEVRHVYNSDDVNELLAKGWILLAVGEGKEQTGQHNITPVFRYSVGHL